MAGLYVPPDLEEAAEEWSANCGPGALAALLECPLAHVRTLLPNWPGYTNPTHAIRALELAGWHCYAHGIEFEGRGLAFVQWCGPWENGANQRWAYKYTHWIAFRVDGAGRVAVYDVNNAAGWCWYEQWAEEIAPLLLPKRSAGFRIRKYIGAWPAVEEP